MQPGDKVGKYQLEDHLGEGAMARVFVAQHPQLEQRVALKFLRREYSNDRQYAARFLEDARAAATLNHSNIVGVRDYDTADGTPFMVMELIDGQSLDGLLNEQKRLEVGEAARIARDIALALAAAHESKIIHRDVKPSNILIDRRTGTAKLTDFGAAKRERAEDLALTAQGQLIGSPRYMAPEQVSGEAVDPRTDLWALGATLYEMLAGQPAFGQDTRAKVFHAILERGSPKLATLRPGLPPGLASLVERLLAKSPGARPGSAAEVADVLSAFAQPTAGAASSREIGRLPQRAAKRAVLIGGGFAVVLVVAALVAVLRPSAPDRAGTSVPGSPSSSAPGKNAVAGPEASDAAFGPDERRAAQRSLSFLGYYRGPEDGQFSYALRSAVREFQIAQGIPGTGHLTVPQAIELHQLARYKTPPNPLPGLDLTDVVSRSEAGEPEAQRLRGMLYDTWYQEGGVPKDIGQAVRWYREAARAGDLLAALNLGWILKEGDGIESDPAEAARWLELGARHGWPEASYALAELHERGSGVPQDLDEAIRLYREAARTTGDSVVRGTAIAKLRALSAWQEEPSTD